MCSLVLKYAKGGNIEKCPVSSESKSFMEQSSKVPHLCIGTWYADVIANAKLQALIFSRAR